MDYDIYKKALRLVKENKVIQSSRLFFNVKGEEEEEYVVKIDNSKVSCTCRYFTIHGAANFRVCCHIIACVLFKIKQMEEKDNE